MVIEAPPNSVHPLTRAEWRQWLEGNHNRPDGVWLITYKKETGQPRVEYDEAVEALEIPHDLAEALAAYPSAAANFAAFLRSVKRGDPGVDRQREETCHSGATYRRDRTSGRGQRAGQPVAGVELSIESHESLIPPHLAHVAG